jgi:L-threonylcarbamoyladenylate synthase
MGVDGSDRGGREGELLADRQAEIEAAARALRAGGLVILPTETVYGLGADAADPTAVAAIFEAKGRPRFNPLICHMADLAMAERYALFDPVSRRLAERFWPGPLTLVLGLKPDSAIHPLATAGLDTVGIRVPKGFAAELIRAFDRMPMAAATASCLSPSMGMIRAMDKGLPASCFPSIARQDCVDQIIIWRSPGRFSDAF